MSDPVVPDATDQPPMQQPEGGKSGWTPPASQDEFNRIITERVARERAKFAGFDDLKTKASEYDKLQEAAKSDLEKANERAEKAERLAAEATTKALRSEIAQAKGVPAALLTGSTEDELNASADALIAFRGGAPKPPAAPPAEGVQGNVGKPVGVTDIDTQIKAANEAGDWRRALSLTNTKLAEQAGKD